MRQLNAGYTVHRVDMAEENMTDGAGLRKERDIYSHVQFTLDSIINQV